MTVALPLGACGISHVSRSGNDWCIQMAVGQNKWYHFGVGAPPISEYFSGDWDVHWGYGLLTHGQIVASFWPATPLEQPFVQ